MSELQFNAEVMAELQRAYEEWLLSQDFVRNKDDWFRYAESASKFDDFMKVRRA